MWTDHEYFTDKQPKTKKRNRKEFCRVTAIKNTDCSEHFLIFATVESLCCTPEIKFCMPTILQEKKNQTFKKKKKPS